MMKKRRTKVLVQAAALFMLANIAHIFFWYFMLLFAPSFIVTVAEVTQAGRSTKGTVELLNLSDQLTVVVMRWGIIPIFLGAIGDLTHYYIGYAVLVAVTLTIWVRRRW